MPETIRWFTVTDGSEDDAALVYARSHNEARHLGCACLTGDYTAAKARLCHPAVELTPEQPGPHVAHKARTRYLAGWWQECANCYRRVEIECVDWDDDGDPPEPVFVGPHAYCSAACRLAAVIARAKAKARALGVWTEAESRWPGITLADWCNWSLDPVTEFRFPGGLGTCRWKQGEKTILVQQRDHEAWRAFADSLAPAGAGRGVTP